jgi:hypothetical protein
MWRGDVTEGLNVAVYGTVGVNAEGFVSKEYDIDGNEKPEPHEWQTLPVKQVPGADAGPKPEQKTRVDERVRRYRLPYTKEKSLLTSELHKKALEAIRSNIEKERLISRLAHALVNFAESMPGEKENKERAVLALDLDLGEGDIGKLFEELAKILPRISEKNEELGLFLRNLDIIKGRGEDLARRVKHISTESGRGKVNPENIIIITPNADHYSDFAGSTIAEIDQNGIPAEAYTPLLEVILFAVTKHMASKKDSGITKDALLYYYKMIPNTVLADDLEAKDYQDLFVDMSMRRFVIRLIPNAVPLSTEEIRELRESLMVALKRA